MSVVNSGCRVLFLLVKNYPENFFAFNGFAQKDDVIQLNVKENNWPSGTSISMLIQIHFNFNANTDSYVSTFIVFCGYFLDLSV